jgi:hypothetical protein
MKYTDQSFQNKIENIVALYPQFKIVEKSDEETAHQILESQGMQLLKDLRLTYSRRPNLWKSFSDSNQAALVFYEKDLKSTIAAFSEGEAFYNQRKITNYYSSDLRMTPKATIKIRKDFREVYQQFIAELPVDAICTTAILKDNIKAMNAFTRGATTLFYNVMFEYFIRTIVVLPTIYFNKKSKLHGYSVTKITESSETVSGLKNFLESYQTKAQFSNDLVKSRLNKAGADEFIILKDEKIVGYFSLFRPTSRSIYVQTSSVWIKALLKLLSLFSNSDLTKKLPWVYLTSLVLSDELKKEANLITYVIQQLLKFKALKSGELLLLIHPKDQNFGSESIDSRFLLKCPQVINTGVMFRVESKKEDRSVNGSVHIDPSEI